MPRPIFLILYYLLPLNWFDHAHQNPKDISNYTLLRATVKEIQAQDSVQRAVFSGQVYNLRTNPFLRFLAEKRHLFH
jgi:hypothetical protein